MKIIKCVLPMLGALVISALPLLAEKEIPKYHAAQSEFGPVKFETEQASLSGTVDEVNAKERELTLKSDSGEMAILKVPAGLGGLNKFNKGDRVQADYLRSAAVYIVKEGQREPMQQTGVTYQLAPEGESANRATVDTVKLTGTVETIDEDNGIATIRSPSDDIVTLSLDESEATVADVQPGDRVVARFTEGLALGIRKI